MLALKVSCSRTGSAASFSGFPSLPPAARPQLVARPAGLEARAASSPPPAPVARRPNPLQVSAFASPRHILLCWAIPLQNLAVAWCILRQPAAYSRHRTGILAVPKLLRCAWAGPAQCAESSAVQFRLA